MSLLLLSNLASFSTSAKHATPSVIQDEIIAAEVTSIHEEWQLAQADNIVLLKVL